MSDVHLAGKPIDETSLQNARRMLACMEDVEPPNGMDHPPWIVAARAAVEDALRRDKYQCEECNRWVNPRNAITKDVAGARGHTVTLTFCRECSDDV